MIPPIAFLTSGESLRLQRISQLQIFSRSKFTDIDAILTSIRDEFDTPVVAITVIGQHFQHVKASIGTDLKLTARKDAFCSYTIQDDKVMVVHDALEDCRFKSNPYVKGLPHIRFYAGAPLRTVDEHRLGALCLMDLKPRPFSPSARDRLAQAAKSITQLLHWAARPPDISKLNISEIFALIRKQEELGSSKAYLTSLADVLYIRFEHAAKATKADKISRSGLS